VATLQEIAKELGLSVSTISRAVNKKGPVKESTYKQVMDAVARYNYIPDNTARSLKTGKTKTIGVIIPDVTEIFFTNVLSGIEEELSKSGYNMLLCLSGEDKNKEASYLNYFSQNHADGIILATVAEDSAPLLNALDSGKGIVCIDNLPNTDAAFDSVINDNIYASELAVNYLVKLGHKKIAVILGKQTETTGADRLFGYRKAMMRLNIDADEKLIKIGDFKEKSGYDAMREILSKNPDVTAVYAASSKMTYGAIKAIVGSGKSIPDDISVVGFDVHDLTGLLRPGITTVRQQEDGIGRIACELLIDNINNQEKHIYRKILLQPELIIRESCSYII